MKRFLLTAIFAASLLTIQTGMCQSRQSTKSLKAKIEKLEEKLSSAEDALNTAYYTAGTIRALRDEGVMQAGSNSRLSRPKLNVDNLNLEAFTRIDIRTVTELNLPCKEITFITQHPKSSYTIEYNKEAHTTTLRITDVEKFWLLTRFLVIRTD